MREIRTSGSMSGEWKRSMVGYSGIGNRKGRSTRKATPTPPRHSSTLLRSEGRRGLGLPRPIEELLASRSFSAYHQFIFGLSLMAAFASPGLWEFR
jgi:hypothetical protein